MPTQYMTEELPVGDPYVPGAFEEPNNTHQKIYSADYGHQPNAKTGEFFEDSKHQKYKVGDKVEYVPVGGPDSQTSRSTGEIERILTSKTNAGDKNVRVNATEEQPQYEVSRNTHLRPSLEKHLATTTGSNESIQPVPAGKNGNGMGSRFKEFLLELVQT